MSGPRRVEAPTGVRSGQRPAVSAAGRVCGAPGCETVLSRYNTDGCCWRHQAEDEIASEAKPVR